MNRTFLLILDLGLQLLNTTSGSGLRLTWAQQVRGNREDGGHLRPGTAAGGAAEHLQDLGEAAGAAAAGGGHCVVAALRSRVVPVVLLEIPASGYLLFKVFCLSSYFSAVSCCLSIRLCSTTSWLRCCSRRHNSALVKSVNSRHRTYYGRSWN